MNQQGLADVTVTNNGATVNTAGKIGSCYQFGPAASNLSCSVDFVKSMTGGVSFAFWVKLTDWGSNFSTIFCINTGNFSWYQEIFAFQKNESNHTMVFNIADGVSSSTNVSCQTRSLELNTWYHFTAVYSPGQIKIYQNGALVDSDNTSVVPGVAKAVNFLIGAASAGGAYQLNGCLNDFRVYDHCLSEKEINELAKGLVLHYPLSDPYIESTINLITTEDCLSSTCYNGATSKYSYGTSTDMYKTVTTYDGKKGTKVYMGTNGNSCYPYVYVNNMFTSDGSNAPAYKTLSFDYYGTVGNYLGPYKLGSGEGTATYTVTCQGIKTTGTYSNFGGFTVTPNKWNHVEITFHGTTAANSEWGYIRIGNGSHTSNTSNFWFFANMQLEAKDHATGYDGVGNTRTATTVYDTSGFGNNGTTVGEFEIASESPRYSGCTYIKNTSNITHPRCLDNTDQEWTCCAWVKLDASSQ